MKELIQRVLFARKPEHEKQGLRSLEELEKSLYRVSLNFPYANMFVRDEGSAVLIGQDTFISLSSAGYVEVAPKIFQRVLERPDDLKFDDERQFAAEIRKHDFENNLIIFVRFRHGGAFKPHYHMTEQRIRCLAGSYVGAIDGHVFHAGEVQVVPPKQIHLFQPIQDGYAVVEQAKK